MRHKISPSDKRVRPANIPPRFTPPSQLYPSPGLRRHLPRSQSFWDSFMWDSLQLKRDKTWALHTYDMESKSGRKRGWKRQRRGGKKRGTERETGGGGEDKREKMRKVENRKREAAEGETAEKCELNELWDADCTPGTFIHSLYHIHDKEPHGRFCSLPRQLCAVCLWYLSVCTQAISEPVSPSVSSPNKREHGT